MNNNYTSYYNLEKIKYLLIDTYAEYLRYSEEASEKYPTQADKIAALEKFIKDIAPIKNLSVLQKMRKRYAK